MDAEMTEEKALRSCAGCRDRKKKCDKSVPQCGRCKRLSLQCSYAEPVNDTNRLEEVIKRLDCLEVMVTALTQEVSALKSVPASTALPPDPRSDLSHQTALHQNDNEAISPLPFEGSPQSLLCVVLLSNEISLSDLTSFYFQSVHQRLGLLSEERLKGYCAVYPVQLDKESSILFLALSLLWLPVHHERRIFDAIKHELFLTTHSVSQKLVLVQAGLLLCYYMLTQGMIEDASMVITACGGPSSCLGSKAHATKNLNGERVNPEEELALRRTLTCLESLIAALSSDLSALSSQRGPFWNQADKHLSGLSDDISADIEPSVTGPLSRHQILDQTAAPLLRAVYEYAETPIPSQSSIFHMGLEIDLKVTRLIFEMKGADDPPPFDQVREGGYVVALWALIRLHLSLLERARELNEPQFEEVSVISLTRLVSIIVQISRLTQRALDDATLHIRHLPLSLCPVLYLSVIAHGRLRSGQSKHDQSVIKGLLVALRDRWKLPGRYLELLDQHDVPRS